MKKWRFLVLIIFLSPLIGGLYGIIHDQITFTISPEYYTKFKFYQFGLAPTDQEWIPNNTRAYVGLVGFLATWWVGLIIGTTLSLIGLIHQNSKTRIKITLQAIGITLAIAIVFGIIGFAYGRFFIDEIKITELLPDIIHKKDFYTVGSIHNLSYLGGLIGLVLGILYSIRKRIRISKSEGIAKPLPS